MITAIKRSAGNPNNFDIFLSTGQKYSNLNRAKATNIVRSFGQGQWDLNNIAPAAVSTLETKILSINPSNVAGKFTVLYKEAGITRQKDFQSEAQVKSLEKKLEKVPVIQKAPNVGLQSKPKISLPLLVVGGLVAAAVLGG